MLSPELFPPPPPPLAPTVPSPEPPEPPELLHWRKPTSTGLSVSSREPLDGLLLLSLAVVWLLLLLFNVVDAVAVEDPRRGWEEEEEESMELLGDADNGFGNVT